MRPFWIRIQSTWKAARSRWWTALLIDLALLVPVIWVVMLWTERNLLPADGSREAPGIQLVTLEGNPARLGGSGKGDTLVYFFAPWCSVCRFSVGNVQAVRDARPEEDLAVYLVALDWPDVESVRRFVSRHDLTVPVLLGTPEVKQAYQVDAYPTYYVLDSEGRVVARSRGYSTEIGIRLRLAL